MRIVDAHTHAFPTVEDGNAWQRAVGVEPKRSGQIEELRDAMQANGVERAVVLLFHRTEPAYNALLAAGSSSEEARTGAVERARAYNRWGCELAREDARFAAFVSVDPRYMSANEIREEIEACIALGARGAKIIPSSLRMYADDDRLQPVFATAEALGVPVLSQSGVGSGAGPRQGADPWGRPKYFSAPLERHPRLRLILAHLGLGFDADIVDLFHRFPTVLGDLSGRLTGLGRPGRPTKAELAAQIRSLGAERILFGSNFPLHDQAACVQALNEMPLSDDERELIAWRNFDRIVLQG